MKFEIPPLWQIVLMLILIPIAWIVIWFVLALIGHFTGIPVPSVGDTSALLSSIGSIMGAVFAVGGLIIALVSILTQIQLEDRIQKQVNEAKHNLEETFETKLRAEYEKQIQDQIEGTLAFADATRASDWKEAEALMSEALQKYQNLPGAYSIIGLRLSQEVESSYRNSMFPSAPQLLTKFSGYIAVPSVQLNDIPKLEAITWLEDAMKHQDNPEMKVSLALALMYGYNEYYDKMMSILAEIKDKDASLLSFFYTPTRLFMLILACRKDYDRIRELANAIDYSLPTRTELDKAIHDRGISPYQPSVDWFAIELPDDGLKTPVIVRIFQPSASNESYASIFSQRQQSYTIPPLDPSRDPSQGIPQLPIGDLMQQIFHKFFIICRVDLGN